ncbi:MAG: zinc-ribbon domain-containing protein [Stygiobacter sp.]|jgi:hypothetical protein
MKCINCGTENNDANKFCRNCGNELKDENNPQEIICQTCGAKNKPGNNYCILCGENLIVTADKNSTKLNLHNRFNDTNKKRKQKHSSENKNYQMQKKIELKPVLITAIVIIVSYLAVTLIDYWKDKNTSSVRTVEIKSTNPVVESIVYEIASKFVCSCGTCGEKSLEKCTCPHAEEERQFIRDYVGKNGQKNDIVVALANKYGYLKSEYAKDYKKVDVSKIWKSNDLNTFSNSKDIIK